MFLALSNAGAYGLSTTSVVTVSILFGLFIPVLSILGPTREALGKNLRVSLDPSRGSGADEAISVTMKQGEGIALSTTEVLMSLYLIMFGFCTYYVIPAALMNQNFGVFFFVMNFVLTGILIGMILIVVIVLHNL